MEYSMLLRINWISDIAKSPNCWLNVSTFPVPLLISQIAVFIYVNLMHYIAKL